MSNFCYICFQHGDSAVKTNHLEYMEGGILDMDDLLSDLVEDRDKVRMNPWTTVEVYFVIFLHFFIEAHTIFVSLHSSTNQHTDI